MPLYNPTLASTGSSASNINYYLIIDGQTVLVPVGQISFLGHRLQMSGSARINISGRLIGIT